MEALMVYNCSVFPGENRPSSGDLAKNNTEKDLLNTLSQISEIRGRLKGMGQEGSPRDRSYAADARVVREALDDLRKKEEPAPNPASTLWGLKKPDSPSAEGPTG